jgi:hypothetical protein
MPERLDGPRHVSLRIVPQGTAEREFDDSFWKALGPEARLLVLWDMVLEREAWTGERGDQPRLQRSVLRVQRA